MLNKYQYNKYSTSLLYASPIYITHLISNGCDVYSCHHNLHIHKYQQPTNVLDAEQLNRGRADSSTKLISKSQFRLTN